MNGFDNDFLEFLKTNHQTDYLKAVSDDVKPETLNRIYSDYSGYFRTWLKVPATIRSYFNGQVPDEIMQLAAAGKTEILQDIAAGKPPPKKEDEFRLFPPPPPEKVMAAAAFLNALTEGYNRHTAYELSEHRLFRDILAAKALAGSMTDTERKEWLHSREKDKHTLKRDWADCHQEKMLIHLFSKFNRGKIGQEELLPQVVELMQRIESGEHKDHLLGYLKSRPIQAKLAHFKPEVLDLLSQTILQKVPEKDRDNYLQATLPLQQQIALLIDKANNGRKGNLAKDINSLVELAGKKGMGLDLRNYTADSQHPMSAEMRQTFMIACNIHNVPYLSPHGERINPASDQVKKLPSEIQALVLSRDMRMAKENMIEQVPSDKGRAQTMSRQIPSTVLSRHRQAIFGRQ